MALDRKIEPWSALLDAGRADGRLVREATEGPAPASLVELPAELHPEVLAALRRSGIERLYAHQAQALHAAAAGPTIVTTGTASGKSMCFNLPTLHVLCQQPRARALYLYPTKALAQDQARALAGFGMAKRVRPAIYDGDTPREARVQIRRSANVVLTNPDMLHVGILPNHPAWADLFANLAVVVIDEAHSYRGVFGSHVANVIRRLRRIAAAYGTAPIFVLTSATIANPVELAERLTGLEGVQLIDADGSPAPQRRIAMWNPPTAHAGGGDPDGDARRSALAEAAELLSRLAREGARTICFMKSRKGVEVLSRLVKDDLRARDGELAEQVEPYRAGYTPQQRRALEQRLVRGELRTVITTDALELGIDIGELDAAVVVTFPGTVASLRQMWGRAGRRGRGLAVYVAGEDALDQFFCRYPEEFLERPVEAAILDHESQLIHRQHLLCAAHEGPLSRADTEFLGPRWEAHAEALEAAGDLRRRTGAVAGVSFVLRRGDRYPAAEVSLRSASPDSFDIVDVSSGELLGSIEAARAHTTVHDGAIYMHQGCSYEVRELDLDRRRALVAPFDGDFYTQPKSHTDTEIVRLLDRRTALGVTLSFGEVSVTETVLAYQRRRLSDHAQADVFALELPPTSFPTQALWFELPGEGPLAGALGPGGREARIAAVPTDVLLGSLHAAEHAQIAVLPLIAMCDRWDIGGLSTNFHPQTGCPTIFLYDGHPGGIGIARTAFRRFEELCEDARRLIAGCPCQGGCPSCVQSPKCGNLNEPLHKAGALALLERLLASAAALTASGGC